MGCHEMDKVMVHPPACIQSHAQDRKQKICLEWPNIYRLINFRGFGSRDYNIDLLDPCNVHKQVEKRIFNPCSCDEESCC